MTDRASDTPRPDDSPAAPAAYQPYVPPVPTAPQAVMVPLGLSDPLRWLRLGWRDFLAAPGIGLFYGVCFWLMAVAKSSSLPAPARPCLRDFPIFVSSLSTCIKSSTDRFIRRWRRFLRGFAIIGKSRPQISSTTKSPKLVDLF